MSALSDTCCSVTYSCSGKGGRAPWCAVLAHILTFHNTPTLTLHSWFLSHIITVATSNLFHKLLWNYITAYSFITSIKIHSQATINFSEHGILSAAIHSHITEYCFHSGSVCKQYVSSAMRVHVTDIGPTFTEEVRYLHTVTRQFAVSWSASPSLQLMHCTMPIICWWSQFSS